MSSGSSIAGRDRDAVDAVSQLLERPDSRGSRCHRHRSGSRCHVDRRSRRLSCYRVDASTRDVQEFPVGAEVLAVDVEAGTDPSGSISAERSGPATQEASGNARALIATWVVAPGAGERLCLPADPRVGALGRRPATCEHPPCCRNMLNSPTQRAAVTCCSHGSWPALTLVGFAIGLVFTFLAASIRPPGAATTRSGTSSSSSRSRCSR